MTTPVEADWKRLLPSVPALCGWAVLLAVFGYAYQGTLWHLLTTWYRHDDYQHCFFVPLFSLFLLWYRREMVDPIPSGGSWWNAWTLAAYAVALPMFAASALIRWCDRRPQLRHRPLFAVSAVDRAGAVVGRLAGFALGMALDRLPGVHDSLAGIRGGHAQPSLAEDRHHDRRLYRFKPWASRPWPWARRSS